MYRFLRVVLISLLAPISAFSQIVKKPDPSLRIDHSNAALILVFRDKGSFSLDAKKLTDGVRGDTIVIANLSPSTYTAGFRSEIGFRRLRFTAEGRRIIEVTLGNDSLKAVSCGYMKWYDVENKVAGKRVVFVIPGKFYFFAEVPLMNLQWVHGHNRELEWFNSFSVGAGYQVAQGFFAGVGISYLNTDVFFGAYYYGFSQDESFESASFLPVYLNIRTHLSNRRVAPFFKFDIGANVLLTPKDVVYHQNSTDVTSKYVNYLEGGGVYLSPGFGLRIAVSSSINILFTTELAFYETKIKYSASSTYYYPPPPTYNYSSVSDRIWLNYFRIKLGVGFQTKGRK